MKKFKLLGIFAIVLCITTSCTDKKERQQRSIVGIEMVAHRGVHYNGLAPENSKDAINLAARIGYKAVEVDLNVTSDGQIVLLHDNELNNTFYNTKDYTPLQDTVYCIDVDYETLRNNYVFRSDNPAMRRPIATLDESLFLFKKHNIYPYIELKMPQFTNELAVQAVDRAIEILGKNNFSITSFDFTLIAFLRTQYDWLDLYCDGVNDPKGLQNHQLNYFPEWISLKDELIHLNHLEGRLIGTWTVAKEDFDIVKNKNVDIILSDEIIPHFDKAKAIYDNHSNTTFAAYNTNGSITNNTVILKKDESISLKDIKIANLYLGGIYFNVEAKGKFKIEATNFVTERENNSDDYINYQFQYLIYNEMPAFSVTALEDGVTIKDLWFAVTEF